MIKVFLDGFWQEGILVLELEELKFIFTRNSTIKQVTCDYIIKFKSFNYYTYIKILYLKNWKFFTGIGKFGIWNED